MERAQHRSPIKTLEEFFKVFMPQTSSTQLRIPKAFTKFFNGIITPRKATLVDHDGNSWDVDMEKINDVMVLKNGWRKFARDKCLQEADFLTFEYDGKSTFYVKIFSRNGCRKEAANGKRLAPVVVLDEDSDECCRKMQRGLKRKRSPSTLRINEKSHSEGPSEGTRSKSKRAHEANDNDYEKKEAPGPAKCVPLKNPDFVITFSGWRVKRSVEVPKLVLRQLNIRVTSKIVLRDENDKLWPVMISTTERGRLYLRGGWPDFRNAKNIQEGHLCDFKFVIGKANVAEELLVRVRPPSKLPE